MATVTGAFALPLTVAFGTAGYNTTGGSFAVAITIARRTRGTAFSLTPPAAPSLTLTPATVATLTLG